MYCIYSRMLLSLIETSRASLKQLIGGAHAFGGRIGSRGAQSGARWEAGGAVPHMRGACPRCSGLLMDDPDYADSSDVLRALVATPFDHHAHQPDAGDTSPATLAGLPFASTDLSPNGVRRRVDLNRRKRDNRPIRPCGRCARPIPMGSQARYHPDCLRQREAEQAAEYRRELAAGTRVWTEMPAQAMQRLRDCRLHLAD